MSIELSDIFGVALSRHLSPSSNHEAGDNSMPIRKLPIWVLLLITFLLGVVVILSAAYFEIHRDFGIVHEIGVAFMVAAILGWTIDFTLKSAIAEDVFRATLGHILRPEFRNEVSRITGYKFICERHVLVVEVKLLPNHVVEVTTSIERSCRNITAYPEKHRAYISFDEWEFPNGPSKMIECQMSANGQTFMAEKTRVEGYGEKWETKEATIKPNETFKIYAKFQEYRRDNDIVIFHFTMPSQDPEIEVKISPELAHTVSFGGPDETEKFSYAERYQLKGMYFPHQAMNVRWWPKKSGTPSES